MFLKDLRVIDWAEGVTGPFAARILGDLGAEVVKVERFGSGDPLRAEDEAHGGRLFGYVNSGKMSVCLNPAEARDRELFQGLIARSHVLIVTQTRDELEAWGFTPASLRKLNPALAVISVASFSPDDPLSRMASSDLTVQHHSGFAYHQARPVHSPASKPPVTAADRELPLLAGVGATITALWGLLKGDRTGRGAQIDFANSDFYSHLLFEPLAEWSNGEREFGRQRKEFRGTEVAGGLVWILACKDGWIMTSPREQHQWDRWMAVLGKPDWATDPAICGDRATRKQQWSRLQELMSEWTMNLSRDEIFKLAQAAQVPCFPVSDPADALGNEHLVLRHFFDRLEEPGGGAIDVPGIPFVARTENGTELPRGRIVRSPALGQDNERVFAMLTKPLPAEAKRPAPPAGASTNMHDVLKGIRVVDFSWVVAGPMTTKMLAAMGAEVIKIESSQRPEFKNRVGYFPIVNASKRSFTVDITNPEGQALLHRLVGQSDAVVENFSSRVLQKYRLDYQTMRKHRSDLIFCSASGLGRTGPLRDAVAYGTLLQGYSGRASLVGEINKSLDAMGIMPAWTDPVTAMWETVSILAAIRHRQQTGEGAYIDLSMLESTIALLPESIISAGLGLNAEPRGGNREPDAAPSGCFRALGADEWVAVSVRSDAEWTGLCAAIGRSDWTSDRSIATSAGRLAAKDALNAGVAAWLAERPAEEGARRLAVAGVPASRSRSMKDLLADDFLAQISLFPSLPDGNRTVSLPWRDKDGWSGELRPAPKLGADNEYVLGELLGIGRGEIDRLVDAKIVT